MRFMIIVKSCDEFEAETSPAPDEALMAEMVRYHEELAQAGVLLDGSGLHPSRKGWRIQYSSDGKKLDTDFYSYTLKARGSAERKFTAALNTQDCALNLVRWRNLSETNKK